MLGEILQPVAVLALIVALTLALIAHAVVAGEQRRRAERKQEEAQERGRRAALDADRIRWGEILSTQPGSCGRCGGRSVLKVYATGNIEAHCSACGYRAEV